jgi:hypothetical protein
VIATRWPFRPPRNSSLDAVVAVVADNAALAAEPRVVVEVDAVVAVEDELRVPGHERAATIEIHAI